jgi:hypothetical protein
MWQIKHCAPQQGIGKATNNFQVSEQLSNIGKERNNFQVREHTLHDSLIWNLEQRMTWSSAHPTTRVQIQLGANFWNSKKGVFFYEKYATKS